MYKYFYVCDTHTDKMYVTDDEKQHVQYNRVKYTLCMKRNATFFRISDELCCNGMSVFCL